MIVDTVQDVLQRFSDCGQDSISAEQLKDFKKRKLITNMSVLLLCCSLLKC